MSEGEQNAWGSGWLFCFQILLLTRAKGTEGGSGIDSYSELRGDALQAKDINSLGFASLTLTCLPVQ